MSDWQNGPIDGARHRDLRWHADGRGALTECLRASWSPGGGAVAQVYLSETLEGVVKAWHYHLEQWDRFVPAGGRVLLALYDPGDLLREILPPGAPNPRSGSRTEGTLWTVVLDLARGHRLVEVPPGVLHGWMGLGPGTSCVLNMPSREYVQPGLPGCDEYRVAACADLPGRAAFDWHGRRDG